MTTDTEAPRPIAGAITRAITEHVVPWGDEMDPPTAEELEQRSARAIAEARRIDAANRFAVLADEMPEMVETDWSRPCFARNHAAIEAVRHWSPVGGRGLLIAGATGLGKSRAVIALLRRLACDEGRDFRYWAASSWFAELARQNQYGRDEARPWVDAVAARPIVVIDDLGQEAVDRQKSEWAHAWFFRFLDARLARGLPLVVTTNLTSQQIAQTEDKKQIRGDPLVRRLLDLCEVVKFQ